MNDHEEALQYFIDSGFIKAFHRGLSKCDMAGIDRRITFRAFTQLYTNRGISMLPRRFVLTEGVEDQLMEIISTHLAASFIAKRRGYVQTKNRPRT